MELVLFAIGAHVLFVFWILIDIRIAILLLVLRRSSLSSLCYAMIEMGILSGFIFLIMNDAFPTYKYLYFIWYTLKRIRLHVLFGSNALWKVRFP